MVLHIDKNCTKMIRITLVRAAVSNLGSFFARKKTKSSGHALNTPVKLSYNIKQCIFIWQNRACILNNILYNEDDLRMDQINWLAHFPEKKKIHSCYTHIFQFIVNASGYI